MARARSKEPIPPPASERKRLEWLEKKLSRGLRETAVCALAVEEWGVSERSVWRLIAKLRDRWDAESSVGRPRARAEVLAQIDAALAEAYEKADLRMVKHMLSLKADLWGLKLRSVVVTDATGALTPEERARIAADLDGELPERTPPAAEAPDDDRDDR